MDIIKISVFVLLAVIFISSLPTFNKEISVLIMLSCCIVVLLYIVKIVAPAIDYIKNITSDMAFSNVDVVLKAVGIGFVTQFVSDTALDCGNRALSNQMIFAGRICILMLAMPLFFETFEIIERLIVL